MILTQTLLYGTIMLYKIMEDYVMKKLSLLLATLLACGAICVGCAPEDPFASMGGSSSSSTATSSSSQTAGDSSQVGQDSSSSSQQQTTTVTFNTKNWGTVNPITVRFIHGESYQLPTELILSEAEKQQDEYTFMGWTYNGTPIANSGTWTIQEESVELVAILDRNYTNWH
jgi:hypothetical protein